MFTHRTTYALNCFWFSLKYFSLCFLPVETSRTKLKDDSGSPVATRKIIKPDLSLLMSNSFDVSSIAFNIIQKACYVHQRKRATYCINTVRC